MDFRLLLIVTVIALAVVGSGCDLGEVAEEEGIGVQGIDEIRAERTLTDYTDSLKDGDWERACGLIATQGKRQIVAANVPPKLQAEVASIPVVRLERGCPGLLARIYAGTEFPDGTIEPTSTSEEGDEIVVESDNGTFRMTSGDYKILEFPIP